MSVFKLRKWFAFNSAYGVARQYFVGGVVLMEYRLSCHSSIVSVSQIFLGDEREGSFNFRMIQNIYHKTTKPNVICRLSKAI
jgi:hypothetical protein